MEVIDMETGTAKKVKPKVTFKTHPRKSFLSVSTSEGKQRKEYKLANINTSKISLWRQEGNSIVQCYLGHGCCASSKDIFTRVKDHRYYITVDTPSMLMSKGKLKRYTEELNTLGIRMELVGVLPADGAINYKGSQLRINLGTHVWKSGNWDKPKDGKLEFCIIEIFPQSSYELLFYVQLLRNLTMGIFVSILNNDSRTSSIIYYQPQLYFRLRNLFPETDPYTLLIASHVLSGGTSSSTYHPWYAMGHRFIPLDASLRGLRNNSGINASTMGSSLSDWSSKTQMNQGHLFISKKFKEAFELFAGFHINKHSLK